MSDDSSLDLRYPIGGLFVALGLILAVHGAVSGGTAGLNLNLWWGVVMAVFGALMWGLARR